MWNIYIFYIWPLPELGVVFFFKALFIYLFLHNVTHSSASRTDFWLLALIIQVIASRLHLRGEFELLHVDGGL